MKNIALLAVGCLAFLGCSKEHDQEIAQPVTSDAAIVFTPSVTIKSRGPLPDDATALPDGNVLGVYALKHTGVPSWSELLIDNDKLAAYNNAPAFTKFSSSEGKEYYWPAVAGDMLDFYAYFCNVAPGKLEEQGIKIGKVGDAAPVIYYTLQSDLNKQVDLLYAAPVLNQFKTSEKLPQISLVFRHAMAQVRFKYATDGNVSGQSLMTEVRFSSSSVGEFDMSRGIFTNLHTPADFSLAGEVGNNTTGYIGIMLFPQADWKPQIVISIDGYDYSYTAPAGVDLEPNNVYTFTVKYTSSAIKFSAPEVKEWTLREAGEIPVQ